MKVLVTGANGLLGSYVVKELIKRHYKVRVLVRHGSNLKSLDGLDIELFYGELTRRKDVYEAVEGCTLVIHSAARALHVPSQLEAYREVNIDGTRFIIDACKKEKVGRLVYVSTANCIGNGTKASPGSEELPFLPWLKGSGYAYSKLLAQKLVLGEVSAGAINAVIVNPTFILGRHPAESGSSKILSYILNKRIGFYPPGGKNFVYAGAVAEGVVNAMIKGRRGECYLLAGENLSYFEFFKLVSSVAGQHPLLIPVPCIFLKLAGLWGNFSEYVLKIPVSLSIVNARMLCIGNYYNGSKAARELDFPIVSAEEAVRRTIKVL